VYLLKQEVHIRKIEEAIQSKTETQKVLRDTLEARQYSLQLLEARKTVCSSQKGWKLWASSKKDLRISDFKAMLKQGFRLVKVRKRLSCVTRAIESLEASVFKAKVTFERGRIEYFARWGEEECCKPKIEAISIAARQLEQSKQEFSTLFTEHQKLDERHKKDVEDLETKLQAANQQIHEQCTDFMTIKTCLCSAYKDIQEVLCKIEATKGSLSVIPATSSNAPPLSPTSTNLVDPSPSIQLEANPEAITKMGTDLLVDIGVGRDTVIKKLKVIETRLEEDRTALGGYQKKIERMQPLYEVGLDTRHRKFELDIKRKDSRPDWDIVHRGNEAAHYGRALADAIMCHPLSVSEQPQRYPGEFEDQYNSVPAKVVWQHKDFKKFHDLLNWRMDMKQFGYACKRATFDKEFEFLFSRIYPDFKVASDEAINNDPKLKAAYERLYLEYKEACRQYRTARRDQGDS